VTIRPCSASDFEAMFDVINEAACAYAGVIPEDRYSRPYMPADELQHEIEAGVEFWGCFEEDALVGVMGIQVVDEVTLVRHAYVRPDHQRQGVGSFLLEHLVPLAENRVLVGTWADAWWAIRFYESHGFALVSQEEKGRLLRRYWTIPERQVETSVVLRAGSAG
jgi:GNAT superfamily N-acetyltransferase